MPRSLSSNANSRALTRQRHIVTLGPGDLEWFAASRDDCQKCRPQGDKPAHASPTDAKRSHHSARWRWVTFWVTRKSHRVKTLITQRFTVGVRVLSRAYLSNTYNTFLK